jgi:hypothetical protein
MPSAEFGFGLGYMKVSVFLQGKSNNDTKTKLELFYDKYKKAPLLTHVFLCSLLP